MSADLMSARLCDPAEASFAAYTVTASHPGLLDPGTPNPWPVSGALLRALLINARECGGAIVLDDLTGTIEFTYASGTFHRMVQTARPLPDCQTQECDTCGQWESEHGNPNASCCDDFQDWRRPGTVGNPLCETCKEPYRFHRRRYTVACGDFRPTYEDAAVKRDMHRMRDALVAAGLPCAFLYDPTGRLLVQAPAGPFWVSRTPDHRMIPGLPRKLRWHAFYRGEGEPYGYGPGDIPGTVRRLSEK
ncbi:hypothetical protein HCJ76_44130 [Streptomyces sp. MC1]|uniref:hypothetical protein n=1 Tax=Streptomyces sp. MC1 TaxID=295105 RepID=UPI0018CAA5A1|nr:hypothetical protein [Streptomyces sp. MC1]MBG7704873.1 hypothetical protein [Streptomyces sp. MC1]